MYDVTMIYSSPMVLITGDETEYCCLNCLWRDQNEPEDIYRVGTFLNVMEPSRARFDNIIGVTEDECDITMPSPVREALWQYFLSESDSIELGIRSATIVVG